MTKKQNRTHGFGRRSLSVVLSVLMILSTFAVMLCATSLSANAAISYWNVAGDFNDWGNSLNNTAYRINGGSGSVTINISSDAHSSIKFKMCAYEDGWKWCGNSSGSTSSGDETELSWNSGNDIQMNLPSGTTQVTFKIEVKNGKNYLTATANGSGGGGEGPDSTQMTFSAPVNTSNSANTATNLFWANATYFDYESDQELVDSWLKPVQAGTHNFNGAQDEWYPFYCFNREVIKAQADQQSSWSEPLYFGNFCDTNNAYDSPHHQNGYDSYGYREATNSYNVTRFVHIANNSDYNQAGSAHLANMNCSYQGLVNSQLSSSGDLLLPNGQQAPYFNSSESGPLRGYAKVVNSSFPFKVTDVSGKNYKKYTFNSKNATDNVYFTWNTSNGVTYPTGVNYGAGTTYGVLDGVSRFMNNGTSGYGIFPFNNASNNYKGTKTNANENLNYGFGIKTQMKFRVPAPGSDVNTADDPIYFSFSGDDDLWMYITDDQGNSQLVLDMGGDHKESTGYVNFNTKKATVDKVGTGGGSVTKNFTFDYSKTYTMTVFYMERGLIESNCKMEFTMYPAGNQVNVEKKVDVTNINHTQNSEALQDAIGFIDSFDFTAKQSGSESGTYSALTNTEYMHNYYGNQTTGSDGIFPLEDTENASFLSKFTTNNYVQIEEANPNSDSNLRYNTTWSVSDPQDSSRDTTGNGLSTNKMQLKHPNGEDYEYAELDYTFVNTPKTGSVSVTKTMNSSASSDRNKEFNATVTISLTGANGRFRAYPLTYTASDKTGTFETDANGNLSSSALLKHGRTLTFSDLPTNAVVKVTEVLSGTEQLLYTPSYPNGNTVTVPDGSVGTIGVTNTPIKPDEIVGSISGTKKFDNANYTGTLFSFKLEGVPRFAGDSQSIIDTSSMETKETTTVNNGTFTIDGLVFDAPGVYRYHLYEDMSRLEALDELHGNQTHYADDISNEETHCLVSITVTKVNNQLVMSDPVYYPYDGDPEDISSEDFDPSLAQRSITFYNTSEKAYVEIEKTNQSNQPVEGVLFAVIAIDDDTASAMSGMTDIEAYDYIKQQLSDHAEGVSVAANDFTDEDGYLKLENLPIYQTGYRTSSAPVYQKYCLIEYAGPDSYSINKTVYPETTHCFSFPMEDASTHQWQYHCTFEYVNGKLRMPSTAGVGMTIFKILGFGILGFAVIAFGGYMVYTKKRKTAKHYVK